MNKNITPYNNKQLRHGAWERYYYDGDVIYKCFFVNGILNGYHEHLHITTDLIFHL